LKQFLTYLPKKRWWISTVAWPHDIGLDRTSETMAFKGTKKKGITDYHEKYFESHGRTQDYNELETYHNDIVRRFS